MIIFYSSIVYSTVYEDWMSTESLVLEVDMAILPPRGVRRNEAGVQGWLKPHPVLLVGDKAQCSTEYIWSHMPFHRISSISMNLGLSLSMCVHQHASSSQLWLSKGSEKASLDALWLHQVGHPPTGISIESHLAHRSNPAHADPLSFEMRDIDYKEKETRRTREGSPVN